MPFKIAPQTTKTNNFFDSPFLEVPGKDVTNS